MQSALDIRNELSELRRELGSPGELIGTLQPTNRSPHGPRPGIYRAVEVVRTVSPGSRIEVSETAAGGRASRREPGPSRVRRRRREPSNVVARMVSASAVTDSDQSGNEDIWVTQPSWRICSQSDPRPQRVRPRARLDPPMGIRLRLWGNETAGASTWNPGDGRAVAPAMSPRASVNLQGFAFWRGRRTGQSLRSPRGVSPGDVH